MSARRTYLDPTARAPGILGATGMTNQQAHLRSAFPMMCEHCDGEHCRHLRFDRLRGWIGKTCDSALDEMFEERP